MKSQKCLSDKLAVRSSDFGALMVPKFESSLSHLIVYVILHIKMIDQMCLISITNISTELGFNVSGPYNLI